MSISLQPRPSQLSLNSPNEEEDLGWKDPWYHSDDELDPRGIGNGTTNRSNHTKGKAKATGYQPSSSSSYPNGGTDETSNLPSQRRNVEAYPPTTDEDTDTRRVVENLRRWEIAERQRWKAARESTSGPTSVLADVARRATSLWSRRASRPPADGAGRHRVLQTSEDSGHLEDLAPSPSHSAAPSRSPSPSPGQPHTGPYARSKDPFSDPPGSTSSLFVNAQPITSDLGASASFVELDAPASATGSSSSESTKVSKPAIAPAPLDLPKPLSPPPRGATPHANRPPEPFPRPDSRMSLAYDDEDKKPVRWWTDWLCGCNEGSDRGGEVQAGRTNPLE